jgi:hypothetical protein
MLAPAVADDNLAYQGTLAEAQAIAAQLDQNREDPLAKALRLADEAKAAMDNLVAADGAGVQQSKAYENAAETYAESLEDLGRMPHPDTLAALSPAVDHPDPQVRLAAVRALREGAAQDSQAPVLATVRGLILSDPEPEIRREAFEVYCRWGDQEDMLLLAMDLGRKAGPLQAVAVREWIRIETERQALAQGLDELQIQQALR